jgi:hypothetical protein
MRGVEGRDRHTRDAQTIAASSQTTQLRLLAPKSGWRVHALCGHPRRVVVNGRYGQISGHSSII